MRACDFAETGRIDLAAASDAGRIASSPESSPSVIRSRPMSSCPIQARLPAKTGDDEVASDGQGSRLPSWLSPERIADARHVWSKTYERVISEAEAVEILLNVRRLAEALLPIVDEEG
jgi:hypothetical protein